MRREFTFLGEQTEDGLIVHDRDEVRQCLLDLEAATFRLGGMFVTSAVRSQIGPDEYVTTGVVIRYESFSPAVSQAPLVEEPIES